MWLSTIIILSMHRDGDVLWYWIKFTNSYRSWSVAVYSYFTADLYSWQSLLSITCEPNRHLLLTIRWLYTETNNLMKRNVIFEWIMLVWISSFSQSCCLMKNDFLENVLSNKFLTFQVCWLLLINTLVLKELYAAS